MPDLSRISELDAWIEFSGRLHPLLVHFPIALLIIAFVLEVIFGRKRSPGSVRSVLVVLAFGALGGLAAAGAGWLLAENKSSRGDYGEALELHRWIGVATAAISLLALFVGLSVRKRERGGGITFFRWLLFLGAGGVGAAGHLGAGLVWGDDFLFVPFAAEDEGTTAAGTEAESDGILDEVPEDQEDVSEAVAPIPPVPVDLGDPLANVEAVFAESCYECHGPDRARAGLRMDRLATLIDAEDPSNGYVVPGDLDESWLWTVVNLPEEDEEHMPLDRPTLAPEALAMIEAWILAGAPTE